MTPLLWTGVTLADYTRIDSGLGGPPYHASIGGLDCTGNWNSGGGFTRPPVEVDGGTLNERTTPVWPVERQCPAVRNSLEFPLRPITQPVHTVLSRPTRPHLAHPKRRSSDEWATHPHGRVAKRPEPVRHRTRLGRS